MAARVEQRGKGLVVIFGVAETVRGHDARTLPRGIREILFLRMADARVSCRAPAKRALVFERARQRFLYGVFGEIRILELKRGELDHLAPQQHQKFRIGQCHRAAARLRRVSCNSFATGPVVKGMAAQSAPPQLLPCPAVQP